MTCSEGGCNGPMCVWTEVDIGLDYAWSSGNGALCVWNEVAVSSLGVTSPLLMFNLCCNWRWLWCTAWDRLNWEGLQSAWGMSLSHTDDRMGPCCPFCWATQLLTLIYCFYHVDFAFAIERHQCILFGPVTLETSMTVTSDLELASLPVTINTRLTPFEHNIPLHLQRITHTWSWQIPSDRKVWRTHKDTTVTDRHNKPNWTSSDHPQSYW